MWFDRHIDSPLYTQPVWVHWVGVLLLLIVAYQAGALLQRLMLREPCTDSETALVGSALALLAFVIGFTFSIALSRYDERRNLVLAEANAIGTTWLRAGLVPEPVRSEMQAIIIRYTDTRIALFDAGEDLAELRRLQGESQKELALLWDATTRAVPLIQPAPVAATLVQTVNETIDLAESRRTTYITRIPPPVSIAVGAFAVLTAGLSGFARGGRRHFVLSIFTFAMMASILALINDLDRPSAGAIQIRPGPLLETRAGMAMPPPAPAPAVSAPG